MKEPKYKVPSPEELSNVREKIKEKEIWYDIDEWQMSVKLRPCSFGKYMSILHDTRLQTEKQPQYAELQQSLAWITACLVEPELSYSQLQQLADADARTMLKLAIKCQVLSGNLPEDFDPEVELAKDFFAPQEGENTGESSEPA